MNSSECEKYIRSGVPKNSKKKQEFVDKILAEAEMMERRKNYSKGRGFLHEASKRRKNPASTYYRYSYYCYY